MLLGQEQDGQVHPTAYASRTWDPHERNYRISELETLALVRAVRYFRPYIHVRCMHILVKHSQPIQKLDLVIKYRSGKSNANAESLSRKLVASLSPVESLTLAEVDEPYCTPRQMRRLGSNLNREKIQNYYHCMIISLQMCFQMTRWRHMTDFANTTCGRA